MNNIFFIGIQEEYNLSVEVMLRELRVTLKTKITKERNQQQDPYLAQIGQKLENNNSVTLWCQYHQHNNQYLII